MMRMVFWTRVDPERVEKIGSSDDALEGLSAGETIRLRTPTGDAKRTIREIRIEGSYRELVFEPFVEDRS